ncbi:MAG: LysM peptidoglycan-binding domain-containing protein [Homoserinimonas sp.]
MPKFPPKTVSRRAGTDERNKEGLIMSDTLNSGTGTSRLRLTRRGRAVVTTLAALPLVFAALAFALNGGMATATVEQGSTSYLTVLSGQSLWQLAEEVAPGDDTREVVAQLLRANALESAEIFPGQQLAIPSQYR